MSRQAWKKELEEVRRFHRSCALPARHTKKGRRHDWAKEWRDPHVSKRFIKKANRKGVVSFTTVLERMEELVA